MKSHVSKYASPGAGVVRQQVFGPALLIRDESCLAQAPTAAPGRRAKLPLRDFMATGRFQVLHNARHRPTASVLPDFTECEFGSRVSFFAFNYSFTLHTARYLLAPRFMPMSSAAGCCSRLSPPSPASIFDYRVPAPVRTFTNFITAMPRSLCGATVIVFNFRIDVFEATK